MKNRKFQSDTSGGETSGAGETSGDDGFGDGGAGAGGAGAGAKAKVKNAVRNVVNHFKGKRLTEEEQRKEQDKMMDEAVAVLQK